MQHNTKMEYFLGWSIKKCGSFLKYVVLVSKTVDYIFSKWKCFAALLIAEFVWAESYSDWRVNVFGELR